MKTLLLLVGLAVSVWAAGLDGKWTASFDTQIGTQSYTYTFKVEGNRVTGTAENGGKKYTLQNGRLNGDTVTFLEVFQYQDQDVPIEYTGKIAGDEIRFTRKVAEYAVEEFTAVRAK